MMGHHHKLASGDEYDILTGARKLYKYTERPGVCRKVKTRASRRYRRQAKRECQQTYLETSGQFR